MTLQPMRASRRYFHIDALLFEDQFAQSSIAIATLSFHDFPCVQGQLMNADLSTRSWALTRGAGIEF